MPEAHIVVISVISLLGLPVGTFLWALWLSRTHGAPKSLRMLMPIIASIAFASIAVPVVVVAIHIKAVARTSEPSDRATMLAGGISDAINYYAFGALALTLICVALATLTVFYRSRWRRSGP